MSFSLYNRFRDLEKVRVDSSAIEGYLGATNTDGVLRTSAPLTYTDGGNYVTLGLDTTASYTFGPITVDAGAGQAIIIKGTSTGNANLGWIGFYDSDGTTRRGHIGDGSVSDDDIYIGADTGYLRLLAAGYISLGTHTYFPDDIVMSFGASLDYSIGYYSTDGEFQIVDGSTLDSNVRLKLDSSGHFDFGAGNLTTTGEIDITKGSALLLDLNPGFTGTGNVIELTPSAAIVTEDAAYCGFFVDGTLLTPTSAGVEIDGIFIDFSAITLGQTPAVHGLHIKMPEQETALHTDGEIHVDYKTGSPAGAEYTAVDIILDVSSLDTNSEIHGLDVALAGSTSGSVAALGSHPGIDVIHQHVGTFGNIDTGYTLVGSTYTAEAFTSATAIVAANGDSILIGEDAVFDEIQVAMTVVATKTAFPKFYYSYDNAGTAAWTQFFPADDTEGFVYSGTIRMNSADLVAGGWEANDPDDAGGVTATKFYIKITRNRTASIGSPTATLKTLASTEYMWDKTGAINVLSLSAGTLTSIGTVTIPTALTGVIRADSGVLSVDSDVTDIVSAASTTAQGKVELTIASEINTGTSTTLAVTPDSLAGSYAGTKIVSLKPIAEGTALTTGDGKMYWVVPLELNGMDLVSVGAHVFTVSSSGTPTVQIYNLTQTADMLSTVCTIDANELDSKDAGTPAVIDTGNDDVATGDALRVDVDVAGTGTAGMEIRLGFRLP